MFLSLQKHVIFRSYLILQVVLLRGNRITTKLKLVGFVCYLKGINSGIS